MKKLLSWLKFFKIIFFTTLLTYWMYFVEANKEIKENYDELYGVYREKPKSIYDED